MNSEKLLTLLGFCRKAGKLTVGFSKVSELLKSKKAPLVLIASDISKKTEKEVRYLADNTGATVVRISFNTETLSHAIGFAAGVVATCDEGFCKAILQGGIEL